MSVFVFLFFFFFKQKTAYEMRISDWSSDVCSSDLYWPQIISGFLTTIGVWVGAVVLGMVLGLFVAVLQLFGGPWVRALLRIYIEVLRTTPFLIQLFVQIGRASCRERVCQYV